MSLLGLDLLSVGKESLYVHREYSSLRYNSKILIILAAWRMSVNFVVLYTGLARLQQGDTLGPAVRKAMSNWSHLNVFQHTSGLSMKVMIPVRLISDRIFMVITLL